MNNNCLENKRCPKCGAADEVLVYASMWVSLRDDGTDPYTDSTKNMGGTEYDEDSYARCPSCGHNGKFKEWTTYDRDCNTKP